MSGSTLFRCLACCLATIGLVSWSQAPRPADTILVNGNVIGVDDVQPRAQAAATAAGPILAVGTDAEVRAHETAATRVIDLGGRTVVPGLADNHFQSAGGGAGVDLAGACMLAEALSAIAAAVREAAPDAVVVTNSGAEAARGVADAGQLPVPRARVPHGGGTRRPSSTPGPRRRDEEDDGCVPAASSWGPNPQIKS